MTYIPWSSDFALYICLEEFLMYEHCYLGLWVSMNWCLTSKLRLITVTYIPWSIDFALYLEDYLMYEYYYLGLWVSMTQSLTKNKYRSLWPIFHGPVILRYNLKTIWYMNIIFWDYGSVWPDVWPQNKCSPVILSYISKTIWCMSVIFLDNETV